MTIDEADLKADMHRAIQAWFDCKVAVRPSAFALGERIRTIALKADAATTMTGDHTVPHQRDCGPKEFWAHGL